ncbi:MAG: outer membrane lipoprotein carrier protein LolA, partial [Alphaproteobacteria bacterium]|nr:outer membrane lipoprotein carrier protein LolA [Alphaproteobacteria bacterium]
MILVLVLWLCAFLYPLSSDAADAADAAVPHGESLKRVEDYLNGITTIVADFTQVAPDGSLAGGKFFLKRPGKMR